MKNLTLTKVVISTMFALTATKGFAGGGQIGSAETRATDNRIYTCRALDQGYEKLGQFVKVLEIKVEDESRISVTDKYMLENVSHVFVPSMVKEKDYSFREVPQGVKLAFKLNGGTNLSEEKFKGTLVSRSQNSDEMLLVYKTDEDSFKEIEVVLMRDGRVDAKSNFLSGYSAEYGPCKYLNMKK